MIPKYDADAENAAIVHLTRVLDIELLTAGLPTAVVEHVTEARCLLVGRRHEAMSAESEFREP